MIATHLVDASAWAQIHRNDVAARLVPLLIGGGAATCGMTDLQVLDHFADPTERMLAALERASFPRVAIDDTVLDRAIEVQGLVGGVRIDVLVVAAAAELAGLVLLHHDDDFDRIADATNQAVERA